MLGTKTIHQPNNFMPKTESKNAQYNRDNYSAFLEKPLPCNPDAERITLGAILLDNRLLSEAALIVQPEDFYSPTHRHVFRAMLQLHKILQPINPVQIAEQIKANGTAVESLGGVATITNLTHGLPHFNSIQNYAEVVKEKAELRRQIKILTQAVSECLNEERKAKDIAAQTASELVLIGKEISKPVPLKAVVQSVRQRLQTWKTTDDKALAVPTSIPELNAALRYGGYAPDDLIMIAARPSIGKSAFMLDSAAASALAGFETLVFSLEMSKEDLVMRMLPQRAGVRNMDIKPKLYRTNREIQNRVDRALDLVENLPVQMDSDSMVLEHIIAKIEMAAQTSGVRMVLLDYLQMMRATQRNRRRDIELEEICTALKGCAKRLHVPIVCLAQLNRNADNEDRRPEMQDVREAGASEQIVDVLIMPYRAESRRKERKGKAVETSDNEPVVQVNLFLAKQRNGAAGFDIRTDFDMDYQRFMSNQLWLEDRLDKFNTD